MQRAKASAPVCCIDAAEGVELLFCVVVEPSCAT
jgi:hypothetical protein